MGRMVMAAVANQPPPPCFFSLPSSPSPCSTLPTTDATSSASTLLLTAASVFPPPPNPVTVPTSNRSPILPSRHYDGHAGAPLFSSLRDQLALPCPSHSFLYTLHSTISRWSPPPPLSLDRHKSPSLGYGVRSTEYGEMLSSSDSVRTIYSSAHASQHPLPASHLGVCVGRNQGQERSRPTGSPTVYRFPSHTAPPHRHDYTKRTRDNEKEREGT
ncbi:uncharacterized protein LOC143217059 [Lasioglossum baleicum]|uniref:uncharacterized protein LOC143217059 n=1 Tax=Lasioglossum baleicum TaxID=434251 RepID=UPI003FCDA4CF